MSLEKVYDIMSKIENESSKNGKEIFLKMYRGDKDFRSALVFLLNPFVVTGISTKKMAKDIAKPDALVVPKTLDAVISYLSLNYTGRDTDVVTIQAYIDSLESDELKEFVRKFVTKDLKLGISAKTVNKVYGKGTIPSFAVMLAESYFKKISDLVGDFYVTLKLDGNRCLVVKDSGKVKFFTRTGQEINGLLQLEQEFKSFPDNTVYDGEIILKNTTNLPSAELYRATQKIVRKDGDKYGLEFYMFDSLPLSEFQDGQSKKKYSERRSDADAMFSTRKPEFIKLLPVLYFGSDKTVVTTILEQVEADGYEGLMVNTADGLYLNKRTKELLKVKTMKTADLLVTSVEEAIDGQFKGLLGRVNVEYKDNSVGVGSGFTLKQRKEFIDNPELIVGKIVEIQYFEESKDERTELPSLRFPIFKGIRDDKTVDDISYE